MLPIQLTRHIDGRPVSSLDDMASNGHFRIVVFVGSRLQTDGLYKLSTYLTSKDSPLTQYSPSSALSTISTTCGISEAKDTNYNPAQDPNTIIDLFLIHTSPHLKIPIEKLPAPFPEWQATIYEDVGSKAHDDLGIDADLGALVVVRPDGYVGLVTELQRVERVKGYFARSFSDRADGKTDVVKG